MPSAGKTVWRFIPPISMFTHPDAPPGLRHWLRSVRKVARSAGCDTGRKIWDAALGG